MKKKFISLLLSCAFVLTFLPAVNAQTPQLYIDDELQTFPIYENTVDPYVSSQELCYFVPLREILEKLGQTVEWADPGALYISTSNPDRGVFMKLGERQASYGYYSGDRPSPDAPADPHRFERPYMLINGTLYYPLDEMAEFMDGWVTPDNGKLYIDSTGYGRGHYTVAFSIGRQLSMNAYINNTKIDSPIFHNNSAESGDGNFSNYVLLRPAFEAIGATVTFTAPNVITIHTKTLGDLELRAGAVCNSKNTDLVFFPTGVTGCYIVDGKTYVPFSQLRVLTGGALKQDDATAMSVFTPDFERTDIPATLEEAYAVLDEILSAEMIEAIQNADDSGLTELHFTLGLWIRNQWIYPSKDRIAAVFLERGIAVPDNISGYILEGYRNYLNGLPSDIDTLLTESSS